MNRLDKIMAIVYDKKNIAVNELATMLKVSNVTVRKDLDKLANKGLLLRQHGFAKTPNQNDLSFRLTNNYKQKLKIASIASQNISDGDTIMIESGSTCTLLAEEIARTKTNITIITNSCFIAHYLKKYADIKIILLGGDYQKDSQVNVGALLALCVQNFFVQNIYIGIDGFDVDKGFTGRDIARVGALKDMLKQAKTVNILTDSSKFDSKGTVFALPFDKVDNIFTDHLINDSTEYVLKMQGINVHKTQQ